MTEPSRVSSVKRQVQAIHLTYRREGRTVEIPVIVHHGQSPGPVVALTANIHGDECTGLGVIREMDQLLMETEFRGTVLLYPSCNPLGLMGGSRFVQGNLDLNRAFPGHAKGTFASRLAHALWKDFEARDVAVLIDLHSDARRAIPYAIVDRPVRLPEFSRQMLGKEIEGLAESTGFTVLREYDDALYTRFRLDHSLAGAAVNIKQIPAITLEVGPPKVVEQSWVHVCLGGVLGVLGAVGVVEEGRGPIHHTRQRGFWRRSATPRTRTGGLLEPCVELGQVVKAGDVLARFVDLTGTVLEQVHAFEECVVVSWKDAAWIEAGSVFGTLGVRDEGRL